MAIAMRIRVGILLVGLIVAAAAVTRADRREGSPNRSSFTVFPTQIGDWRGKDQAPLTKEVLAVLGASDYLTRVYQTPDRAVIGLYIGYWNSQRQGDTIHSPLNCLPGAGWQPVDHGIVQLTSQAEAGAGSGRINRYIIQKGLDRQLVLYWYQSHGRIVASEYWGKFYLVADAVRLNRTDGSIVRVIAPIDGNTREAEDRAQAVALRFVQVLRPQLGGFIPA
jgi:EpsI family protein